MTPFRLFLAGLCLLIFLAEVPANDVPSGRRVALLIGNSDYTDFQLRGVSASLDQVERALSSNGFTIDRRENLNESEFKDVAAEFAQSVPTNGVAVVYYIGLAAHVERLGKVYNVLRPVKTSINSDNDYRSRGLNISDFLKTQQEKSGARINLLFLDASWDSPIRPEQGAVSGGLTEFEPGPDTTVVFAAGSGKTIAVAENDAPSVLSKAISDNATRFNNSIADACRVIAAAGNDSWFGGVTDGGIGQPSNLATTLTLHDGKSPGEGFVNSIGLALRWCPPGQFKMGSDKTGTSATRDRKAIDVTLTKGFWMGEHEVTQREYSLVMRKNPPLGFTTHRNAPFWGGTDIKGVTDFCNKLNDIEKKAGTLPSGWEYVCPTEAEWEYACRANSRAAYCFGDAVAELGDYANFADKTLRTAKPNYYWADRVADDGRAEELAPVGSYRPNAWGLRDMHGNVAELVADHLLPELPGGKDPLARLEKNGTTQIRGGAWCSRASYCESSFRNAAPTKDKHNFVGFRVALKKVK